MLIHHSIQCIGYSLWKNHFQDYSLSTPMRFASQQTNPVGTSESDIPWVAKETLDIVRAFRGALWDGFSGQPLVLPVKDRNKRVQEFTYFFRTPAPASECDYTLSVKHIGKDVVWELYRRMGHSKKIDLQLGLQETTGDGSGVPMITGKYVRCDRTYFLCPNNYGHYKPDQPPQYLITLASEIKGFLTELQKQIEAANPIDLSKSRKPSGKKPGK